MIQGGQQPPIGRVIMGRQERKPRNPRHDAVASIQAEMARVEARRLRAVRLAIGFAVPALLVLVVLTVSTIDSGVSNAMRTASGPPATLPAPSVKSTLEPSPEPEQATATSSDVQRLNVAIGDVGYEPTVVPAKAGIPIELTVAQGDGCAAGFLIPKLGIEIDNSAAAVTRNLGILGAGDYRFTCSMQMVEGVLRVR